ncbi:GerAB/ArcD/ProY family transporter [Anaeroselena agilis]|uniref:Endospore germination permease n=1 Tax=Anaeroselena agilis TaxID=3063788 RepID=A0ABU3P2D4_9FIRM|nr:endospore germination permease [Selenomonadales bacterium 4137-cl]
MADLEVKTRMSPLQLAIIIATSMMGISGRVMQPILQASGHGAWLAVLAGAALYYGAAWLMIKLGERFPGESFAEYLPRLLGRWPGGAVVWLFVIVLFMWTGLALQGVSREVTFFMFDRTPFEVVEAGLLLVCAYCCLQDWGTILRVVQLLFFTALPPWLFLLFLSLLRFRVINFLPLWPEGAVDVAAGALRSWTIFQGYECVLLLLPLVYKGNFKPTRAVAGAFALATGLFLLRIVLDIGVLTLEGAENAPYPMLTIVRTVEIPGTFLERLDTYFLVFWIQGIFASVTLAMYFMAQSLTRLYRLADHRPFVLALVPPLFLLGDATHHIRVFEGLRTALMWAGPAFSLGVVPLVFALVWWRGRSRDAGRGKGL